MLQRSLLRSAQRALQSTQCTSARPAAFLQSLPQVSRAAYSPSIRLYSQATEAETDTRETKETKEAQAAADAADSKDATPEDASKKDLEAKKKELLEMTDRYKRSIAEYRNLQDQTKREVEAARNFAIQRFAKDLIESIDNLDRALTTVPADKLGAGGNKDLNDLHGGLKMTERILLETVKKHGLERFDPSESGEKFDPNVHEAVFQAPQAGKEDGSVFYTQQKGFKLNGRVLRAAKVGLVKNS